MQTSRFEMIVRAAQPIAHHQENLGNQAIFARKMVRVPGGERANVPCLSGDTIRHALREAAVYGTLYEAGLLDDPQLSEGALRLLFAGGMVTGRGDASVVNIDRYRELVGLFPPLAILGGCTDNRIMPGQLNVDDGNLLCSEMTHLTPPWIVDWLATNGERLDTCRGAIEEVQRVRMDPALRPEMVKLLSSGARANVEGRALVAETAHETGDAKARVESKSAMMPRTHERLIQGSLLWIGLEARTYTELEFDAFCFSVACLLSNFQVGGKRGTGHGRLEFVAGSRVHFRPAAASIEAVGSELAPKTGELYKAHVRERKEDLSSWLRAAINS